MSASIDDEQNIPTYAILYSMRRFNTVGKDCCNVAVLRMAGASQEVLRLTMDLKKMNV